jgi:hypothetical protein
VLASADATAGETIAAPSAMLQMLMIDWGIYCASTVVTVATAFQVSVFEVGGVNERLIQPFVVSAVAEIELPVTVPFEIGVGTEFMVIAVAAAFAPRVSSPVHAGQTSFFVTVV